jgi:glutamine amidotransferase
MNSVVIVDVGTGNLHSVRKAVEHVAPGAGVTVSADPDVVARASRVILPGQGAIGSCVAALDARGLHEAVLEVARRVPMLGICLGLQMLYEFSEEDGGVRGLGVLGGKVRAFQGQVLAGRMIDPRTGHALKIPHMGWNQVHQTCGHPLWGGIAQDARFYFVHSYYAESAVPAEVAGTTRYGIDFTSVAARDNIFAVQFHPEKSQHAGLTLLENFMNWDGAA